MKNHTTIRKIAFGGILAALYVVLTVLLPFSYDKIQFRAAEALTVFCCFEPLAVPGVIVGCLISNFFSPFPMDIFIGTAATVIAALLMRRCRKVWLMPIPNVAANGLLVGAEIAYAEAAEGPAFWAAFWMNCGTVALGELAVMLLLGVPLFLWLQKSRALKKILGE